MCTLRSTTFLQETFSPTVPHTGISGVCIVYFGGAKLPVIISWDWGELFRLGPDWLACTAGGGGQVLGSTATAGGWEGGLGGWGGREYGGGPGGMVGAGGLASWPARLGPSASSEPDTPGVGS